MTGSRTWKVGPLAEASGVTVRTLHHWDEIGLLSPSRRTVSGHREYTETDLVRLYQVLALRSLGSSLQTIATCLDAGVDPARVVRDHLQGIEASLAALDAVRQRLVRLEDELTAEESGPASATLLDALQAIGSAGPDGEQVLRRHLDPEQIHQLGTHAAAFGPTGHYLLEIEWPELYRRAERLRRSGVPPADERVQRLVRRMDELSALFTGGDAAISTGVREAWRDDPAAVSGNPSSDQWRELAEFVDQARERGKPS
ncbi:MerR family transcriptional regulator [Nocardia sp. NPDC050712]|uniref:MerR family transcriptional regulator n=1 Tax=Nocardia sp. NPDC050712 TaxID=3155518 RepID=UPI0033F17AAF